MIPSELFSENVIGNVIRYGLYVGAAFQFICLLACIKLADEEFEPITYEKSYTDSDEYSSEHSSPGGSSRSRRSDKKKRH